MKHKRHQKDRKDKNEKSHQINVNTHHHYHSSFLKEKFPVYVAKDLTQSGSDQQKLPKKLVIYIVTIIAKPSEI